MNLEYQVLLRPLLRAAMAILVNWFEVTFGLKEIALPFKMCSSSEESTPSIERYPTPPFCEAMCRYGKR